MSDLLILLGVAAALYGLWLIAEPLALVVAGLWLTAFGWVLHRTRVR